MQSHMASITRVDTVVYLDVVCYKLIYVLLCFEPPYDVSSYNYMCIPELTRHQFLLMVMRASCSGHR
jgi:hypothetical protein